MMPVIRVNDSTFANLSTLKIWTGTNTPSETIDYALAEAFQSLGLESDAAVPEDTLDGDRSAVSQSLQFTKPLTAKVNGRAIQNPKWSSILVSAIEAVAERGYSDQRLAGALNIPAKNEKYEDQGYKYLPQLRISIQGQSAQDAWTEAARLAEQHGFPIEVTFMWRGSPKAARPGQRATITAGK